MKLQTKTAFFDNQKWFYILLLSFIALQSYFIAQEFYWFPALSVALLVLYFTVFSLDKLLLFITFMIPFSLNIELGDLGASLNLPTEPLMFGVLCVYLFRILYDGGIDRQLIRQPITWIIILQTVWLIISSLASTLPVVSLKFTLARLWFVVPFYFVLSQVFRKRAAIDWFIWLFVLPLCVVIGYSIINLYESGFDKQALYWVMEPFFKDHTIYGAVLALIFPVTLVYSFHPSYSLPQRYVALFFSAFIFLGILLSYTRATWLSLIASGVCFLLIYFRVKLWILLTGALIVVSVVVINQQEILIKLGRNKQSSSKDLGEHFKSVSNIRNDASNLERLNRWSSALRMGLAKPLTGFGPGTYKFKYGPYQRSNETTWVSTNSGRFGNAHSEYLGPFAEQGLPGVALTILLFITIVYQGILAFRTCANDNLRWLSMGALLGLISYFVHGFLNNFLDSEKAAVPFFALTAIIAAIRLYYPLSKTESKD